MAEYAASSHPQPASLSSGMLAFLFPADCLVLSVNLLELEASEQQVVDSIFWAHEVFFVRLGDCNVVKTKWNKELY